MGEMSGNINKEPTDIFEELIKIRELLKIQKLIHCNGAPPPKPIAQGSSLRVSCDEVEVMINILELYQELKKTYSRESIVPALEKSVELLKKNNTGR